MSAKIYPFYTRCVVEISYHVSDIYYRDKKEQAAYYQRKAAFTNHLPKISAAGTYMRTSDELSLISDEQKDALRHARLAT